MMRFRLIFLVCIVCWLITFTTGFNGLYGQDSHEYYRYAKSLLNFFEDGASPGDYFWPVWYPLIAAMVSFIFKIDILIVLQFVSVFSLCTIAFMVARWSSAESKSDERIEWYSIIAIICSPLMLNYGLTVMADMMSTAFVLLAFFSFNEYYKTLKGKWIIIFAGASSLAVMTRYAAFVLLLIPTLVMVYRIIKVKQFVWLLSGVFTSLFFFFPHLLIRINAPMAFAKHEFLITWNFRNFFYSEFITIGGSKSYLYSNVIYAFSTVFHPQLWLLGVPLIFFAVKRDFISTINQIIIFSIVLYAFFLAGIPFQNKRYLLMSYPLIVIFFIPAFLRFTEFIRFRKIFYVAFVSIHAVIFYYVFNHFYQRNLLERELTSIVKKYDDRHLYAFDIDIAIASYDNSKVIHNLWVQEYENYVLPALVLFNKRKFEVQWKGRNPMINWKKLNDNYNLKLLYESKDGWQLYRIISEK